MVEILFNCPHRFRYFKFFLNIDSTFELEYELAQYGKIIGFWKSLSNELEISNFQVMLDVPWYMVYGIYVILFTSTFQILK
jgi:hypothetical protein